MLVYATFAFKHFMSWLYASLIVSAFGTAGVVDMLNLSAFGTAGAVEMLTVSAFELHDVLIGSANAGTRRTGGCALCRLMLWLYSALCSASLCVRAPSENEQKTESYVIFEKKQNY